MSGLPSSHSRDLAEPGRSHHRNDHERILQPVAARSKPELRSRQSVDVNRTAVMRTSVGAKTLRQPAVAGRFYPANPDKLRKMVDAFMESAKVSARGKVKAVI